VVLQLLVFGTGLLLDLIPRMRFPFAFALLLPCSAAVAAEEVTVSFTPADQSCRGTMQAGERELPFSTSAPVTIDVAPPARILFRAEGCWIAPVDVRAGTTRVEARVWPAATLRGTISVPPGEVLPESLSIRVSVAGTHATSDCTVDKAAWRCPVPSTSIDVRIAADGTAYAPHYFRALHAAGEVDLGVLPLRAGASLVGAVEAVDGASVELRPERIETVDATRDDDATRVRPSRDGFFQFTAVAPGTYEVRATAPGRSTARVRSITVAEAREYVVEPLLRLDPVAPLRVKITPPADALQRPWTVLLEKNIGTVTEPAAESAADVTGWWESAPIANGLYSLTVRDAGGARLHSQRLEVSSATGIVDVRLALIPVRGSVTAGVKPFPSKLDFHQTGGRSVEIETGSDGRFTGLLPATGEWQVRIQSPDRRFYVVKREVEVVLRDDQNVAVVDLPLPGGRVRGTVVDRHGDPVAADVVIYRGSRPVADAATDAEGKFELVGIEPGSVSLRAVTRGAESALVPYDASENGSASARLVVGQLQKVEGWLTTPDGHPVAGALLRYVAPSFPGFRETTTGPSGEFAFRVPAGTPVLTIASLVPGMPIRLQTVDTSDGRPVQLIAGAGSAQLFLRGTSGPMPLLLAPRGIPFPFRGLIFPPDGSGSPPRGLQRDGVVVDLEPGPYQLCNQEMSTCLPADLAPREKTTIDAEALR
jgi:hypothetical protein